MSKVIIEKEKIEEMLEQATDLVAYIEHSNGNVDLNHLSKMALDLYDNIFNIAGDEDKK